MVHSESDKYKNDLLDAFKKKFEGKLSDEDLAFITSSYDRYMFEMIKLMREGKSAHEKFFADIILNSIDAIVGFNNEGEIFLWNKGAEKIFGWEKSEITGKNFNVLIPKDLMASGEVDKMIAKVKKYGFISNHETLRITKTGELINVSISRFVIFNEKGEDIGSVGIIRDITTEKRLEKVLRERENLALIGEVVSSIAHNLSNPLNIISGNADYLLLEKKEGDPDYEELKVIVAEATRITKSIRSILNFAKPLIPMLENISVNELLEEATSGFKFLKGNKNVELSKKFDKKVPSIKIDRELVRDVFLNIISNAIQAIPLNVKGLVEVKTVFEGNIIVIEISDNGSGISQKDLPNIFKPFYTTKGYGKGTGLGLAFADRVIKEHKGTIEVKSEQNTRTSFIISIPV
ncbi:MAG: two-component system sensor histidine kinase NtrB [Ignavibacteria bacterium]